MSKIDFTRNQPILGNKTNESLGLMKKGAQSKVITIRLNAIDEERLENILEVVNTGRAKEIEKSVLLKELIKIAYNKPGILKGI